MKLKKFIVSIAENERGGVFAEECIEISAKILFTHVLCISVFITLVCVSCKNTSKSDPDFNYDKLTNQTDSTKNSPQIAPVNTSQITVPNNISTASTPAVGINPAHGQPGHNCDIAVGAPLNSKPSTGTVEQKQPVAITTNQTTPSSGINPEHGKPGHRCDIAVGAPLNSKPVTTPVTSVQQKESQPAITKKTVTAPGMNPPHGEPGHRCDIGVGSPLNQPVKTNTVQTTKTVSPILKDSSKN